MQKRNKKNKLKQNMKINFIQNLRYKRKKNKDLLDCTQLDDDDDKD